MITEVFGITYEALGDADVDELGLALGLGELDGLADVELDGDCELLGEADALELGEPLGLAEKLEDGEREALGLELVSGSSAFDRTFSVTSSI